MKSYIVRRSKNMFKKVTGYMCDEYSAQYAKDVIGSRGNHYIIHDNSGAVIGWFMRAGGSTLFGYGLPENHFLFVNHANEDFAIFVNEKYGSLKHMKVSDARECDDITELELQLRNSSLCILYPVHTIMPKKSFLDMYQKFGVISGMHYLYDNGMGRLCHEELHDAVNNYASSKRFRFSSHGVEYASCVKCAHNDFNVSFNQRVFTKLHSFLLFLSHCF